ncbi:Transcription initiation factor TFIID subunit 7 [Aphelenchoides besseyi]|nr:Transcription initiation factor TFIID subunit 7 [Aphelenchoides besseyi]
MTSSSVRRKGVGDQLDDQTDWENHYILRVPKEYAQRVRTFCNDANSNEQLRINFNPDLRKGTFRIGNDLLHFTTYDLPCILEVNKTLDDVALYKTGDISQLLLCTIDPQPEPSVASSPRSELTDGNALAANGNPAVESTAENQLKAKREKFYQFPHGIAPPLKNARKKRFRKTKKKKYMDAPEVEKEVKRLLRLVFYYRRNQWIFSDDLGAVSIRWEVTTTETSKPTAEVSQAASQPAVESAPPRDLADDLLNMDEDSRMTEEPMSVSRDFIDAPTSNEPPDETSQAALADDVFGALSSSSEDEIDL